MDKRLKEVTEAAKHPAEISEENAAGLRNMRCMMDMEGPFRAKSAEEIYAELKASRECCERGEYEDFRAVIKDVCEKHGLY